MQGQGSRNGDIGDFKNLVPTWDGKPETFSHFVTEIRWALNSTKKDERALLASPRSSERASSLGCAAVQVGP